MRGGRLLDRLRAEGVVDGEGRPGPSAERWSPGGFARVRLDDPGRPALYANLQGGFHVRCPTTGEPVVRAFEAAVALFRATGERTLACPCGAEHDLHELAGEPPFAIGPFAVVTADVALPELAPEARAWAEAELGPTRMVMRRT